MDFNGLRLALTNGVGAIVAIVSSWFGGWDAGLTTLMIFMIVDYLTGLVVAGVFNKSTKTESGALESRAGWKGLCRKGVTLAIVLVAYRLDLMLGSSYIRDAVIIGFCINELISLLENVGLMGVDLPPIVTKAVELLKNKYGNVDTTDVVESVNETMEE